MSSDVIVFFQGPNINLHVGDGNLWQCPMLCMSVNGLQTDFDGSYAARYARLLPRTADVFFKHKDQIQSFGPYGKRFLDFLRLPVNIHQSTTCKEFALHFLAGGDGKFHPNQTWRISPEPVSDQFIIAQKPMSVIELHKSNQFVHAAFHLEHGLLLYKVGFEDTYVLSDFDTMRKAYDADTLYVAVLVSVCHGCKQSIKPDFLQKCGACKQVTYCGKECQKKHWTNHKLHCKLQQDPTTMVHQFRRVKEDVQRILAESKVSSQEKAMNAIEMLLTMCNIERTPCTALERWNDVWCDKSEEKSDDLIKLECPSPDCERCTFLIGRFTRNVLNVIMQLSAMKAICFVPVKLEVWEKAAHGSTASHLTRAWNMPDLEKQHHTIHGTYQAPFLIHCILEQSKTRSYPLFYHFKWFGQDEDALQPFDGWKLIPSSS